MPANFFSLPLNVRESIYEYVWCSSSAHIVHPSFKDPEDRLCTFPEAVEPRYPPPEDEVEEEEADSEGREEGDSEEEDGDWEDDAEGSDVSELVRQLEADELADDDEEEDEEEEDSEEDNSSADLEAETNPKNHYLVQSTKALDISLLSVNHQLNNEALPFFYRNTTFVLDMDCHDFMKFLRTLPDRARENITNITLTQFVFAGDDAKNRKGWGGQITTPKSMGPPTMVTPMGAFLATKLPALETVSFYFPFGGGEDHYPPWAPTELLMLLWHRKISLLHFVFLGPHTAATLKESSGSDEAYETLMGDWGEDAEINIGEHLYELENPAPTGPFTEEFRKKCQVYFAERDQFAAEIDQGDEGLIWEWGIRTLDMGMTGNVQAVVSMWMSAEGGEEA